MSFKNTNMMEWIKSAPKAKKSMPVLSFPGIQLTGLNVGEMVKDGAKQADCMEAIAKKFDTLAAVSNMDLSVEAEAFGSTVRFSDDEVPTVISALVNDEDEAIALKVPKVGDARTGEYVKAISLAVEKINDRPVFAGMIGPFSLSGRLMDMTEIMCKTYTDPEEVHIVLEKATEFLIEYAKAFKETGANGLFIAEPAAGLLSPELIGEFSSPYVKKIIDALQDEFFVVIYHNCGNTIPLIKEVLETGASIFHFGNSIKMWEIIPLMPSDKIVMGNVDPASQFRNGTPESLRKATLEVLEKCSAYDNFIISSGCDIPPVSPMENIEEFFNTVKEFYQ